MRETKSTNITMGLHLVFLNNSAKNKDQNQGMIATPSLEVLFIPRLNNGFVHFCWLVVLTISKNISQWMSMGRIIPYIMENKTCLKPPTSFGVGCIHLGGHSLRKGALAINCREVCVWMSENRPILMCYHVPLLESGPPKIAKLVYTYNNYRIYGSYNELVRLGYKPTYD